MRVKRRLQAQMLNGKIDRWVTVFAGRKKVLPDVLARMRGAYFFASGEREMVSRLNELSDLAPRAASLGLADVYTAALDARTGGDLADVVLFMQSAIKRKEK